MKRLTQKMIEAIEGGKNVVLCTILASSGSSPRGAGARMAVFADGSTMGTIGGGRVELLAAQEALEVLKTGKTHLHAFCLAPDQVASIGMICGGDVTVYFQLLTQQELPVHEQPFRIIGEALHTYIIVEQGEAILFIDKHAAHERIRFEALKKEDHPIMAQLLLAPVSAELSREEAAAVLENRALLERCGFEAEDFGGGDVLIRQIPSDVDVEDAKALLQELAGKLLAGKTLDPNGLRDELLHSIACKSAIKAGWQTSDEELRRLVQEVLTRDDIKYCPHGRPVCVTLTKRQLEKQFKRV